MIVFFDCRNCEGIDRTLLSYISSLIFLRIASPRQFCILISKQTWNRQLSVYRIGTIASASLSYFGVKVIDSSVACHLVFSILLDLNLLRSDSPLRIWARNRNISQRWEWDWNSTRSAHCPPIFLDENRPFLSFLSTIHFFKILDLLQNISLLQNNWIFRKNGASRWPDDCSELTSRLLHCRLFGFISRLSPFVVIVSWLLYLSALRRH